MTPKVTEPTDSVSSRTLVEKGNGKLRICVNLAHLNQALKRSLYPSPLMDVPPELADAKVIKDLKDGFLAYRA